MLTELKVALADRSEEMRSRELKALAAYRGVALEQVEVEEKLLRQQTTSQSTDPPKKARKSYPIPETISNESIGNPFALQNQLLSHIRSMAPRSEETAIGDSSSSESEND